MMTVGADTTLLRTGACSPKEGRKKVLDGITGSTGAAGRSACFPPAPWACNPTQEAAFAHLMMLHGFGTMRLALVLFGLAFLSAPFAGAVPRQLLQQQQQQQQGCTSSATASSNSTAQNAVAEAASSAFAQCTADQCPCQSQASSQAQVPRQSLLWEGQPGSQRPYPWIPRVSKA